MVVSTSTVKDDDDCPQLKNSQVELVVIPVHPARWAGASGSRSVKKSINKARTHGGETLINQSCLSLGSSHLLMRSNSGHHSSFNPNRT